MSPFPGDPHEEAAVQEQSLTDLSFPIVDGSVITWVWASIGISWKGANSSLPSAAAISTSSQPYPTLSLSILHLDGLVSAHADGPERLKSHKTEGHHRQGDGEISLGVVLTPGGGLRIDLEVAAPSSYTYAPRGPCLQSSTSSPPLIEPCPRQSNRRGGRLHVARGG